jgi:hypothetical protein
MKKKIIGVIICILLISTIVLSVEALHHSATPTEKPVIGFVKQSGESQFDINLWGGIGVNADIKNHGTTVNVTWQLEVRGSIIGLIHKSAGGVLVVQGGESRWVSTGPFLGIGPFTVTAKANDVEKTAKGIVLLFYVIILS